MRDDVIDHSSGNVYAALLMLSAQRMLGKIAGSRLLPSSVVQTSHCKNASGLGWQTVLGGRQGVTFRLVQSGLLYPAYVLPHE